MPDGGAAEEARPEAVGAEDEAGVESLLASGGDSPQAPSKPQSAVV